MKNERLMSKCSALQTIKIKINPNIVSILKNDEGKDESMNARMEENANV